MRIFILVFVLIPAVFAVCGADAASLEEIDRLHNGGKTSADFLSIETLMSKEAVGAPAARQWRAARNYFMLGKRAGDAETRKRYFNLCLDHVERALDFDDKPGEGYYFKALCLGKLGEMEGIWSSLFMIGPFRDNMERAVALNPAFEYGGGYRALGKYYYELPFLLGGDIGKSIDLHKQALRYGPVFADNHYYLAESLEAGGDLAEARSALRTFLELSRAAGGDPDMQEQIRHAGEMLKKIEKRLGQTEPNAQRTENR